MEFGKFDQKILNDKIIWLSIDLEKHLKFKFQIHRIDCGSQKILNYLTSFKNIAKRPQFNSIQNRIQYSINLLRQFNMRFESKPNIISFSAIKFWLFHLSCGKSSLYCDLNGLFSSELQLMCCYAKFRLKLKTFIVAVAISHQICAQSTTI